MRSPYTLHLISTVILRQYFHLYGIFMAEKRPITVFAKSSFKTSRQYALCLASFQANLISGHVSTAWTQTKIAYFHCVGFLQSLHITDLCMTTA